MPVANSSPPATWTTPLILATVSASDGTLEPTGSGRELIMPNVGRAASAAGLGFRRASTPRAMKVADNIGRAILLINMT
ncbi:hypothetical protein EB74_21925 [Mycobacterium sp. SWH-M5]|nr:hypothetical protein EB74_21925 [Mycobacterium sp. SWH-M5]